MKKFITIILLVVIIYPSFALASWWNPFSWKIFSKKKETATTNPIKNGDNLANIQNDSSEEIQKLKQQIEDLKKQKIIDSTDVKKSVKNIDNTEILKKQVQAELDKAIKEKEANDALISKQKTQEENKSSIVTNNPQRKFASGKLDLTAYNELGVLDYSKNHKASLNKPVKIVRGTIAGFIQNNENYLSIIDNYDTSTVPTDVVFRVASDNDYTSITNQLSKWDNIIIYGYGDNNVDFTVNSNSGSYVVSKPVINVDAIYKCPSRTTSCSYPYEMAVTQIFEKTK